MGTCLSATSAPTAPILGSVHDHQLRSQGLGPPSSCPLTTLSISSRPIGNSVPSTARNVLGSSSLPFTASSCLDRRQPRRRRRFAELAETLLAGPMQGMLSSKRNFNSEFYA